MASSRALAAQKSAVFTDQRSQGKEALLQCLTRLNDKSTLRVAAEELSEIIKARVVHSLMRAGKLLQLNLRTILTYSAGSGSGELGSFGAEHLQHWSNNDSMVREASCEALAAYAWVLTEATGGLLPGGSSSSHLVKVIFDSLAEQKKEAQLGASQALLLVSPFMAPIDKDMVKLILRLLKSATSQGTAQLLAAIANMDNEMHAPNGLLKPGTRAELSGASSTGTAVGFAPSAGNGSGILGCLGSKDWAVRRAAADTLKASVVLLGPALEPEGCWSLGNPGSLTHRCLDALESGRFDKVKEARDATREATVLIQHLHRFVHEQGPAGDWTAWLASHMPSPGFVSPSASGEPSPVGRDSADRVVGTTGRLSPVNHRFQQTAAQGDVISEPGRSVAVIETGAGQEAGLMFAKAAAGLQDKVRQQASQQVALLGVAANSGATAVESAIAATDVASGSAGFACATDQKHAHEQDVHHHQEAAMLQQVKGTARQHGSHNGGAAGSRSSASRPSSRAGSLTASRRSTTEQQQDASAPSRQSSVSSRKGAGATAAAVAEVCYSKQPQPGAKQLQPLSAGDDATVQPQRLLSRSNSHSSSKGAWNATSTMSPAGLTGAWMPTLQEWQQVQEHIASQQQQLVLCQKQFDRLYKSEEWGNGGYSSGTGAKTSIRRPILAVPSQEQQAGAYLSGSGASTPNTASHIGLGFDSPTPAPGDLDLAYADALRGEKGDVHLLRLIQKTGPVWGQLSPKTSCDLLAVFIRNVRHDLIPGTRWSDPISWKMED
eukprot:gene11340-11489_t